jgi:hypothetical protein
VTHRKFRYLPWDSLVPGSASLGRRSVPCPRLCPAASGVPSGRTYRSTRSPVGARLILRRRGCRGFVPRVSPGACMAVSADVQSQVPGGGCETFRLSTVSHCLRSPSLTSELGDDLLVECLSDRAGGGFPDDSTLHPLGESLLHDDDVAVTSAGARERTHQVGADCLPWLLVWCRVRSGHLPRRLARRAVPDVLGGLLEHAGPVVPER